MKRDGRPLYLLRMLGVGLAVTLALAGVDRWFVRPGPRSCCRTRTSRRTTTAPTRRRG